MSDTISQRFSEISKLFDQLSWHKKDNLGVSFADKDALLTVIDVSKFNPNLNLAAAAGVVLHNLPDLPEVFSHQGVQFLSAPALRAQVKRACDEKSASSASSVSDWLVEKLNPARALQLTPAQEKVLANIGPDLGQHISASQEAFSCTEELTKALTATQEPEKAGAALAQFSEKQKNIYDKYELISHFVLENQKNSAHQIFMSLALDPFEKEFYDQDIKIKLAKKFAEIANVTPRGISTLVDVLSWVGSGLPEKESIRRREDASGKNYWNLMNSSAFFFDQVKDRLSLKKPNEQDLSALFDSVVNLASASSNPKNQEVFSEIVKHCERPKDDAKITTRANLVLRFAPFLVPALVSSSLIRLSEFTVTAQKMLKDFEDDNIKTKKSIKIAYPQKIKDVADILARTANSQVEEQDSFASSETYRGILELVDKTGVYESEVRAKLLDIKNIKEKRDQRAQRKLQSVFPNNLKK